MRLIVALLIWAAGGLAATDARGQVACPYDPSEAVADTLDPAGYYPLQEGNVWEYEARDEPWLDSVYRLEVLSDTLISDTLFWKLSRIEARWPGGATDPNQPGAVTNKIYLYRTVADGVLLHWHHRFGITERFDFNRSFKSCYGEGGEEGESDRFIVSGMYRDTVMIEGAGGEVETIPVPASKSFGEKFATTHFANGIGETGGGVETTTIRLRYARVDGAEYGEAFSGAFAPIDSTDAQLVVEPDTLYVESRTNEVVLINRGEPVRVDSLRFAAFLRPDPPGVNWYTDFEVWAAPDSFSHTGTTECYGYEGGCYEHGIPFQLAQGGSATVYLNYDSCPACKRSSGRRTSDSLLIYTSGAEDTVRTVFLDFSRYVSVEEPASVDVPVEVSVYPSPARERATVSIQAKQPAMVHGAVFDVLGREVLSFPSRRYSVGSHEYTLDRRDLPSAGLYFLRYEVEAGDAETRVHVVPLTWQ